MQYSYNDSFTLSLYIVVLYFAQFTASVHHCMFLKLGLVLAALVTESEMRSGSQPKYNFNNYAQNLKPGFVVKSI